MRTILLLILTVCAFAADTVETYDSGNPRAKYATNKAGEKHGRYEEYFDAKKKSIKLIAAYKNGQLNGDLVERDEKGRLLKQETWIDGALEIPMGMDYIKQERAAIKAWAKVEVEKVYDDLVKGDFAPVAAGRPEKADMIAALARLNEYRLICGVSRVGIDLDKQRKAQGAVVVCSMNGAGSHTPTRPAKASDEQWALGSEGCATSNLGPSGPGWMDELMDDSRNALAKERPLGHRLWLISAAVESVGLGALDGRAATCVMPCGQWPKGVVVAYPPAGFVPMDLVKGVDWCVSAAGDVPSTVTIERVCSTPRDVKTISYMGSAIFAAPSGVTAGSVFKITAGKNSYTVRIVK